MLNFINLLTASVTMPGGTNEVATQAANAVSEVATEATSAASIFGMQMGKGGSTAILILYIAALALVFYFFAVRPQKKRAAQLKEIQQGIKVGDEVMTSSGFYGKVVDTKRFLPASVPAIGQEQPQGSSYLKISSAPGQRTDKFRHSPALENTRLWCLVGQTFLRSNIQGRFPVSTSPPAYG